jgi:hypothetical protein
MKAGCMFLRFKRPLPGRTSWLTQPSSYFRVPQGRQRKNIV